MPQFARLITIGKVKFFLRISMPWTFIKVFLDMVDHIEKQAEAGCKFAVNSKPTVCQSIL